MFQLTSKEMMVLTSLCDALVPSIDQPGDQQAFWKRKASDLDVHRDIVELLQHLTEEEQRDFKLLMRILSSPMLGLTWWGPLRPFHKLTPTQQSRLLQSWSASRIGDLRKGFVSLKKLCGFFYFGKSPSASVAHNPNWHALKYPGPIDQEAHPDVPFAPADPRSKKVWDCDVVVVGSGAGGSIVAAELAAAGQKVIIVEKGSFYQAKQFNQREGEMMRSLYDTQAALTTVDGNMSVLAGSCVGGGTTVNWAGSFRTPDYILEEWAKEYDNPHFLDASYQQYFEKVEERTAVTETLDKHNLQNQVLWDGCEKLNYKVKIVPRNIRPIPGQDAQTNWQAQGYSPLGDRLGGKQSALLTYLMDAAQNGATLLADALVERIVVQQGRATGVVVRTKDKSGQPLQLEVKAKKVVVAAGSIYTPALLLRSGIEHPHLGRNLYLHPTTAVSALYDRASESWFGPMMSAVCDQFTRMDGNFGVKLETPPVHPGLMAASINWLNGRQYKEEMLRLWQSASFIVLTRDKIGGRIRVDKDGRPRIHYRLSPYDRKHLIKGIQEAVRIHAAAGAVGIDVLHQKGPHFDPKKDALEAFIQKIPNYSWEINRYFLATAHQMGTCRMGGRTKDHPLQPNGALRGVQGVFVADASAFPSASGANPMLSVQALACYISDQLKATL